MKVLIVSGGNSSERDISFLSAKEVKKALQANNYHVYLFDLIKGTDQLLKVAQSYDLIFPVIHGEEGEGGNLHQILAKLKKPIIGGNPRGYRQGWYKLPFKFFCQRHKIPTAEWKTVKNNKDVINFAFPCVLKSSDGGSSKEVVILKSKEDLAKHSTLEILNLNHPLFVEKHLQGVEVTVGVLNNQALPVIEIVLPKNQWFDFENKYSGKATEIPNAPSLSRKTKELVQKTALYIHQYLNLGQFSRTDFIVVGNTPYALEVNTIPGLTPNSLFPKAAQAAGISFNQLIDHIVKLGVNRQ